MRINWSALLISLLLALFWAVVGVKLVGLSVLASAFIGVVVFVLILFTMGIAHTARSDDD